MSAATSPAVGASSLEALEEGRSESLERSERSEKGAEAIG